MNKTPSILVDTGFEVDQNGALTEIDTPNVVATLKAPAKVKFNGTTLSYIPSVSSALVELEAPNVTTLVWGGSGAGGYTPTYNLANYAYLRTIKFDGLLSLICTCNYTVGAFQNCTNLSTIQANSLKTIAEYNGGTNGAFWGCSSMVNLNLPSIESISASSASNGGTFGNCNGLQSVTLGSEGHPVSALWARTFYGCTQTGLTITIYTTGGASLSGEPWGATNAVIEYEEA